jgi:hypothetical protein
MVPATSLQDDGGTNRLQFAQCWLPFGWFWYSTDAFEAFAANAELAVANTTGAATAALVIPCKSERLETTIDHILRVSAILTVPFEDQARRVRQHLRFQLSACLRDIASVRALLR